MRDPDLVLVESMQAPLPLDDARSSLDYWERRSRALPRYRRSDRREAREMAARWEGRVRAAQQARFDAGWAGRTFATLGISTAWIRSLRIDKRGLFLFAWMFVPFKAKLIAGAVVAAWLLVMLAVIALTVTVFVQLLGW
jgi:hypothetical protein